MVFINCTKGIKIISGMYLVQFINPTKSLDAIYAVMSEKFGFGCYDASRIRLREGGRIMNERRIYQFGHCNRKRIEMADGDVIDVGTIVSLSNQIGH